MSHLTLETLARLVDDAPDPTEAGHLDLCELCRSELEALRADSAALRLLPDPAPPAAAWSALEARLEREGLKRGSRWRATALRMAAVLAVFVLGSVAGALLVRQQTVRYATTSQPEPVFVQRAPITPPRMDSGTLAANAYAAERAGRIPAVAAPAATTRPAATADEAAARVRDAELAYLAALGRFAELSGRNEVTDPLARLAALESIVATTRAALGQAPADPVLNGYHLTAVAQRDAMLRQLAASQETWY